MYQKTSNGYSNKYTQREWDRVVGIGNVPDEYRYEPKVKEVNNESKRTDLGKP